MFLFHPDKIVFAFSDVLSMWLLLLTPPSCIRNDVEGKMWEIRLVSE